MGAITVFFLYKKFRDLQAVSAGCVLSKDWSAWGECSRNCGNDGLQFSTKSILSLEKEGGSKCKIQDMLRSQSCPGNTLQCGKACVPGDPSIYTWSSCPTCTRPNEIPSQYKIVPPFSPATTGGTDCKVEDVFFTRSCNDVVQACPPDIDCQLEFYYSTSCALGPCENSGQTGLQFLYFRISQQKSGRGKECDFRQLVEVAACAGDTAECDCSENTEDWGAFSECNASCGPGVKVALRKIPSPQCPNVSFTTCSYGPCDNATCIPPSIDLVRAECYLQCAGLPTSTFAAGLCSSPNILKSVCADMLTGEGCAEPQDCSLSTWSQFAPCPQQCTPENLFGTVTERSRYIVQPSVAGGIACTDPSVVTQDYMPCANWVNVSFTKYNTDTNNFEKSVSLAQCFTETCTYSDWYSVTQCQNPQMCSDSMFPYAFITFNRSITGGGNCFTDSSQYFSFSSCTLPACIDCLWSSQGGDGITDQFRASTCAQQKFPRAFFPNILVSQTNRLNDTCQNHQMSCSANPGETPLPASEQQTCSVFYWDCPSTENCPRDSQGRNCSNNGETESYYSSTSFSCRCSCFPGYTGVSCSTYIGSCPIASISGLQCNGMGSCTDALTPGTFSCQCYNSSNTSIDCSGGVPGVVMDKGWCWIYETVNTEGTQSLGLSLKKLLGAQRISQQFSYDSCTLLSANSQDLRDLLSTSFSVAYTSVTLATPKNFNFNLGVSPAQNQNNTFQVPIQSAFLEGVVNAKSPANLLLGSTLSSFYYGVGEVTAQQILLALGYALPAAEGTVSANFLSFKPIAVKNSVPVTVESPLYFSSFQNPLVSSQVGSLYSFSQPLSQTQYLEGPQIGNVSSPGVPDAGTYTQVRWLTFDDFFGASPQMETFDFFDLGPAPGTDAFSPFITAATQNNKIKYISQEGYTLSGAFEIESLIVPTSSGNYTTNFNDWWQVWVDQFVTLTFYGSITKYFNDPNPPSTKENVPCLTVSFPYLHTSTDLKPYSYNYFLPNSANLYSDSTIVALMNYGKETTFSYGQNPNPVVPLSAMLFHQTECTSTAIFGAVDCLTKRYVYNPLRASFLKDETQPIVLQSHRRTSRLRNQAAFNSFAYVFLWHYNPCLVSVYDPLPDPSDPDPPLPRDESLNHPECTMYYQDVNSIPNITKLSLSSYQCLQDTTVPNGEKFGMHRSNPLGTVVSCKLFQWFVKHGKGSSMPITISYNYNNT